MATCQQYKIFCAHRKAEVFKTLFGQKAKKLEKMSDPLKYLSSSAHLLFAVGGLGKFYKKQYNLPQPTVKIILRNGKKVP